jgi:cellulose synthase (UDP-forming)
MAGLIIAIRVAWQKPIYRKTERVQIKEETPCIIKRKRKCVHASLKDISGRGAGLKVESGNSFRKCQKVSLVFDDIQIRCCIVRCQNGNVGVEFQKLTKKEMKYVMELFCDNVEPYYLISQ